MNQDVENAMISSMNNEIDEKTVNNDNNQQLTVIVCDEYDDFSDECSLFGGMVSYDSIPFEIYPSIFRDDRGAFSTALTTKLNEKHGITKYVCANILGKTHQVSRSYSMPGVCRGFHAQRKPHCQAKLVESLTNTPIWDIIIDMRPDSKSFQQFKIFKLNSWQQNKVWVPKGFLHCMIASKYDFNHDMTQMNELGEPAGLQYFVDEDYSPEDEICVTPDSILPYIIGSYYEDYQKDPEAAKSLAPLFQTAKEGFIISDKDKDGIAFKDFAEKVDKDWKENKVLWYR